MSIKISHKKIILFLAPIFLFFVFIGGSSIDQNLDLEVPVSYAAASCTGNFQNVGGVCVPTSGSTGLSDTPVATILVTFMRWLLYIFSFLAIIAFVISGMQYITSAGNEDQMKTAKRNMIYSIVGIVVGLSGLIIITTISNLLSGNPLFFFLPGLI